MSFETIDGLFTINMNATLTLALAGVLLLIGFAIRNRSKFLQKFSIPAPVVGGFLFMIITFIGHQAGAFSFQFENIFQDYFMLAFFTTVGLGASFQLLKKGGKLLLIYWALAALISIIQNIIGIGVGKLVNLEAPYALLASAISMIGGHGAAGSYGKTFEQMGYSAGTAVGMATATFGLISAVLIGGPVATRMIEKNHLTPDEDESFDSSIEEINAAVTEPLSGLDIMKNVVAILVCMALGTLVSTGIGKLINMNFPEYVGAMMVALVVRNLNDKFKMYRFDFGTVDRIGDVMLNLYLSLAMMTLRLWELAGLIGGVLVVLICQVIVMILYTNFVVFPILGKNYDAAVMCAGMCGHALGATPSAMVNMTAITEKYGMSRKAFMVVPIVGAFLVDIVYQPQTIWFISKFVVPLQ